MATTWPPVNCEQVAKELQGLAAEFLAGKMTQGEFYQDLEQLTDIVKTWAAETPSAYT